jgi:hypothetical protein
VTSAATVTSSSMPLWYATRATGVVSLVLLTLSLDLGILVSVRFVTERWPRFVTIGVHRNTSLLVVVFLALHIMTAVLDPYAPVGWPSLLIPFVSQYRPLWLGLGTVAFDLLLALIVTSLLRTRIGHRTWRIVHWAAYACWPVAVVHALGTGTDPKAPFILGLILVCAASVLAAGAWRLASGWPERAGIRIAAGATGAVSAVAVVAWTLSGPLASGWAARAGTPAPLLARAHGSAAATSTATAAPGNGSGLPALPLSTAVSGTISTVSSGSGTSTVTIAGSGRASVAFEVVISGPSLSGGGVQMTTSQVTFGPTGQPGRYTGRVTALNGGDVTATVADAAGTTVSLTLNLTIGGGNVTGTLSATGGSGK